jgi:hypothetical protein
MINLNPQAEYAVIGNPNLFMRLEECILNARTELAKRRLIQTAIVLGGIRAVDDASKKTCDWS